MLKDSVNQNVLCGKSVLMTDHRCSLSLEEEAYNSVRGLEWQLDKDSVSQPWLHVRMSVCCVLSRFSHVRLLVTLWTVAYQAPQSMGFSRQEYWSGETCPPMGDRPDAGTKPKSPALQVDSLPPSHWGSPRMSEGF